jgi:membrane fusion protein, multidrug efflux system
MEKRQIIIIIIAIVVFGGSYAGSEYLATLKEEPVIRKAPAVKKFVETSAVRYSDLKTNVISYGRVENAQSLDLISEVAGRMSQGIRLKEGQNFMKGDLIFFIDDEEASLTLKAQKSNFLRDLAGILPDFKVDFNDNFKNWQSYFNQLDTDKKFPPLPETTSDKEKTFLATKGIYSTYYTIKSSEARLQKHRYYAPFSGSIMEVAMQSGSYVNAGTRIGKILRTGEHEMKVSVETKDIPWIQVGSPVQIYSEESQQGWEGEVNRISDYVNQNTQSVDVFVSIVSNGQKIYDGQFFKASVPARTVKNGMIMPRNAIYNGSEVFVLQDSLLKVRNINVIRLTDEDAIFNGLKEGEELVVEPLLGAYNNMKAFKKDKKDFDLETKQDSDKSIGKEAESSTASN